MSSSVVRGRPVAVLLIAAWAVVACSRGEAPQAPPPAAVDVVTVDSRPLPLELTYTARTAGVREVEVRARVSGILLRRQYEEGSRVKAGDVLFRIDPAPTRAAADEARAQVAVAEASVAESRRDFERVGPLYEKGAVSQRDRDAASAAFESSQASLAARRAALETARLDLSYTEVRAPISGLTSREARSEGSLVTAGTDSSLLTRIVQTDQLYVEFAAPEEEAALLRTAAAGDASAVTVEVSLDQAGARTRPAKLSFIDTAIDPATGTVQARAVIDNRDGALMPGQFVRATVRGVALQPAAVIPARAVLRGPEGSFVWTLDAQDVVGYRPVKLGRGQGNLVAVTEGLASGDRYVVEGIIKVQPGAPVAPNPVTLDQVLGDRTAGAAAAPDAAAPPGAAPDAAAADAVAPAPASASAPAPAPKDGAAGGSSSAGDQP